MRSRTTIPIVDFRQSTRHPHLASSFAGGRHGARNRSDSSHRHGVCADRLLRMALQRRAAPGALTRRPRLHRPAPSPVIPPAGTSPMRVIVKPAQAGPQGFEVADNRGRRGLSVEDFRRLMCLCAKYRPPQPLLQSTQVRRRFQGRRQPVQHVFSPPAIGPASAPRTSPNLGSGTPGQRNRRTWSGCRVAGATRPGLTFRGAHHGQSGSGFLPVQAEVSCR